MRLRGFVAACIASTVWAAASEGATAAPPADAPVSAEQTALAVQLDKLLDQQFAEHKLKAAIVEVAIRGQVVYRQARGESMNGIPATADMHFRTGAFAFTHMSTLMLALADRHVLSMDDKLSAYMPDLPRADAITLKNLANMTSGYADYVYQKETLDGNMEDPFRQWAGPELIDIGTSKAKQFAPGANWGYSHTNYVILGAVLAKAARMPLAIALKKYVYDPQDLTETRTSLTPQIPLPALHAYSSERRGFLRLKPSAPFYEDSTYWDPSWTTAPGAVETSTVDDIVKTMIATGTGKGLSAKAFKEQTGKNLIGFGHVQTGCSACRPQTVDFNYGLGIINAGPYLFQTASFAGEGASGGYLASHQLTIAVATTYSQDAYDAKGDVENASVDLFKAFAKKLAPDAPPPGS